MITQTPADLGAGLQLLTGSDAANAAADLGPPSAVLRSLRESDPSYMQRMYEHATLLSRANHGDPMAIAQIAQESMSTSDFPLLFGDTLSRSLAATYADIAPIWPLFAARTTVGSFKPTKILDLLGGAGILPLVPELAEYKLRGYTESEFEFTVAKRGGGISWSWEMEVNDALGAFQRVPGDLGRAARRTEDYVATAVYIAADFDGPAAWLGTPATTDLTAANLQAALQAISTRTDVDGFPIIMDTPILMVPPSLAQTALAIVNTTETRDPTTGRVVAGNGLQSTPRVVVNPWLAYIDQGADAAATWYLIPAPTSPRPASYVAFLRGYEEPDLRYSNDQGQRVGGGSIAPTEGSFKNDSITYRIREVVGATAAFADAVFVSTGA